MSGTKKRTYQGCNDDRVGDGVLGSIDTGTRGDSSACGEDTAI